MLSKFKDLSPLLQHVCSIHFCLFGAFLWKRSLVQGLVWFKKLSSVLRVTNIKTSAQFRILLPAIISHFGIRCMPRKATGYLFYLSTRLNNLNSQANATFTFGHFARRCGINHGIGTRTSMGSTSEEVYQTSD